MAYQILVVDDEPEIADLIELYLKNEGFTVHTCYSAAAALACIETERLDLALLDVMLPDTDGFAICRKIRETHTYPVIMLTARDQEIDKILGLTLGADDYITKPFRPLEMIARVKAQLRRSTQYNRTEGEPEERVIAFSGLVLNQDTHECSLDEKPLSLTPTEFSILWFLCANRGRSSARRSCSTRSGEKNTLRAATTPSWCISGICVKKCTIRRNIRNTSKRCGG